MQRTPFSALLATAWLTLGTGPASAQEIEARYDRNLERAIMANIAGKIGQIRGSLGAEWREPTALGRVAGLSSLDMVAFGRNPGEHQTDSNSVTAERIAVTSTDGVKFVAANAGDG